MEISDYSELSGMAFEAKEQIAPEDEFFHSVYISGQTRKNHIGITEQVGKLQIRGVDYNLDEVFGIITHIKSVLVKSVQKQNRESTECFSWCQGAAPWKSSTGRMCGKNAAERASVDYCSGCRSQIIVAMIRCNPDGSLFLSENKKPIFIFIRGKGTKYSNVSEYLNNLSKLDLDPIFTPATPESLKFEKSTVNHKRFITKIKVGFTPTKFGNKSVYELEKLSELQKQQVPSLLKAAKNTVTKFNEKFDWSLKAGAKTTGYSNVPEAESFGEIGNDSVKTESKKEDPKPQSFNFDDVDF
jgi:hypothetical protein